MEFYASVDGYECFGCVKDEVFTRRMVGWVCGFTRLWGVRKLKKGVESGCGSFTLRS